MKKFAMLIVLALLLNSCGSMKNMTNIIPQATIDKIPYEATKVIVKNANTQEINYSESFKTLLSNDYKIEKENKEMGYLLASKMDAGDTNVRLNIVCSNNEIAITSEWKPGNSSVMYASSLSGINMNYDWDKTKWTVQYNKPNIAFAKAVQFAQIMGGDIAYK